jgi:hypothetical protein
MRIRREEVRVENMTAVIAQLVQKLVEFNPITANP